MPRLMVINIGAVHSPFRHLRIPLAVVVGFLWVGLKAQVLDEPVKGFQVTDHDRTTGRRKWSLSGETAQNASKDDVLLTGARMAFFDDKGGTNLIVVTPKCVYRTKAKLVTSPEAIQVSTGNGGMSIEGVGFEFLQADTSLIISNQVRATIRKDLAGSKSMLGGQTNALAAISGTHAESAAASNQVVHIFADQFRFQTNRGVFLGRVRVNDPQGTLVCEVLTIELTEPTRRIERITAEQQVVVESGETRASGDKGVYELVGDRVTITGSPAWRLGAREGWADELIFERATNRFRALRNVRMRLPPGTLNQTGFLLSEKASSSSATESARRPADVVCDEFEFVSGSPGKTASVTVCRGNVVIDDERGKLRCALLTIESTLDNKRTERVVADRDVVLEQENNRVACQRAVYLAPVEQIELTGRPAWWVGSREGSSDRITFDLKNRTYRALGAVEMRLPPGATGSSSWLLPVAAAPVRGGASPPNPAVPANARPVEIVSDDFEFRSAPGTDGMDEAVYRGHVRIRDPERMTLECDTLTGRMLPGTSQMQTVVADQNVIIRSSDPRGERSGRGDVATYSAEREEVEMTGADGVDILIREKSGDTRAHGKKIVYARLPDVAVLSGDPRITSPSGVVTGETLVLDHSQSRLKATGYWKMRLKGQSLKGTGLPEFKPKASPAAGKPPADT